MNFHGILNLQDIPSFEGDIVCIPILRDMKLHRKTTRISFIYLYDIQTKKEFIINISHRDLQQTENAFLLKEKCKGSVYVYNKSYINSILPDSIELNILHWIKFNIPIEIRYTDEIMVYINWYNNISNVSDIVPLMCWLVYCRNLKAQSLSLIKNIPTDYTCLFYNDLLSNLIEIENSGISIDPEVSQKFLNYKTTKLYSQYNLYTSTGRPSNHFNSINFAALNKKSGIREMIIPSDPSGYLIEWDYDSMHIRLLADLINFDLPKGNLHEYFGRFYFKTPVISEEMYVKSKNLTWRLFYGDIDYEYLKIPFVKRVYEYRRELWAKFKTNGYIEMPLSGRKLLRENFSEKPTINLIFNYLMQGYETEYNSLMLREIFKYLYKKKSKLILYTYDSFLFDYHPQDGPEFLKDITKILNDKGMETTIKYGKTYHNMVKKYEK